MIDGHIHIEKQPYLKQTIQSMVSEAQKKGISEIYVLEHSHKFKEFSFLYSTLKDPLTKSWYQRKNPICIQVYINFIQEMKKINWPIKVHFGLEICYFKEHEKELKEELKSLPPFDFLIGSVHFVNGIGIDLDSSLFEIYSIDKLYQDYFETECDAINSHIFTYLGHPDLIKKFGFKPSFDLIPYYEKVAACLEKNKMETENNSGLIRFHLSYLGLEPSFFEILVKHHVKIHRSSDAHIYQDIGRNFNQLKSSL